jgi:hypothetical protein
VFTGETKVKAVLEFTLPEEKEEFDLATKAGDMHSALWHISQEIFRPARKHGYDNSKIQRLLEKADETKVISPDGEEEYGAGTELVSELESMFYRVLEEFNIKLV